MKYLRVYSDENGDSHFEILEEEFSMVTYAPPAPDLGVSKPRKAEEVLFLKLPKGWFGDFHPAPKKQMMVMLSGQGEIENSLGEVQNLSPGDVVLLEDTEGKGHRSRAFEGEEGFLMVVPLH